MFAQYAQNSYICTVNIVALCNDIIHGMNDKQETYKLGKFREALNGESIYLPSKKIGDWIISTGKRMSLKKYDTLIGYNDINGDVYFILDGIIRQYTVSDKGTERTEGFGICGSMIVSTQCHTLGKPSLVHLQACSDMELLRIRKEDFLRHLKDDHEFCLWVYGMTELTLCYREMRSHGFTGDAADRYRWLKKERPEIIKEVPAKFIASYLNITEVHLSRIKRALLKE